MISVTIIELGFNISRAITLAFGNDGGEERKCSDMLVCGIFMCVRAFQIVDIKLLKTLM